MTVGYVEIAKIVNRDDGARMVDGNDMRRNPEYLRRMKRHFRRKPCMCPETREGNRTHFPPILEPRRWRNGIEIEADGIRFMERSHRLQRFPGVGFGSGALGDRQAAGVDADYRLDRTNPDRGNSPSVDFGASANMKSPLQATSPSTVATPDPVPILRRI